MDIFIYGSGIFLVVCLGGLGYFTIWRLTDETHGTVRSYKKTFLLMLKVFQDGRGIFRAWEKRFLDLENEIRLQKSDSSRLVEWLDKEGKRRDAERTEFLKALRITERESKIIEISENLKLLRTPKK